MGSTAPAHRPACSSVTAGTTSGRGVTVNGGEFGAPIDRRTARFSNRSPGKYNTWYHYDRAGTFKFLARREVGHVKIPFRWERLQPRLGGPLDRAEVGRIRDVVRRAKRAGLPVILDMHNYGAYYLFDGERGVRRPIGSDHVSIDDFADAWRRISRSFGDNEGVLAYALMAEPFGMPRAGDRSPAEVWEQASQAAVTAIRGRDDDTLVSVPGYDWDAIQDVHEAPPGGVDRRPRRQLPLRGPPLLGRRPLRPVPQELLGRACEGAQAGVVVLIEV